MSPDARLRPPKIGIKGLEGEVEDDVDCGRPKVLAAARGDVKVRRPTIVPAVARRMVVDFAIMGGLMWVVILCWVLDVGCRDMELRWVAGWRASRAVVPWCRASVTKHSPDKS